MLTELLAPSPEVRHDTAHDDLDARPGAAGSAAVTTAVVMGVSASGKTEIGRRLAAGLAVPFIDGDDLHPLANVAKMSAGRPLDDTDREPWLDAVAAALAGAPHGVVIACSSLKASYRTRLRHGAGRPLRFVHLDASEAELRRRIEARAGHFMPASLLTDQLATLEWPGAEPDVGVVAADFSPDVVTAAALAVLSEPIRPRE